MGDERSDPERLVGLVCGGAGCYLYGDASREVIEVHPLEPSSIAAAVPRRTPFSVLTLVWETIRPEDANAFYMGVPIFRYSGDRFYDVPVQFCRIDEAEVDRARTLRPEERLFRGYFYKVLLLR